MASAASSLPVVGRSSAPRAQLVPTELKPSGIATRFFQLVEDTGEPALTWLVSAYGLPSRSRWPCGTITSQQGRGLVTPFLDTGVPQPRCGASLAVWISKNSLPVPSAPVRAKSTSLVVLRLKKGLFWVLVVITVPSTDLKGTSPGALGWAAP
jgi:hypothetical protein